MLIFANIQNMKKQTFAGTLGETKKNYTLFRLLGFKKINAYTCNAKKFIAYKSHPMMGVASTGTGATGFFSFFIAYHLLDAETNEILVTIQELL